MGAVGFGLSHGLALCRPRRFSTVANKLINPNLWARPMDRRSDRNIGTPARKSLPALAALALGLPLLAACSSLGGSDSAAKACPKVQIVRDLSEVTSFQPGAGRDFNDIVSRAALIDYSGQCDYMDDGVRLSMFVTLLAERGPAMTGDRADYRYFVAVYPPGADTPVTKTEFDTAVGFGNGQKRSGSKEELTPFIPLPANTDARDWTVVLGFQLTPDQMAYNRSLMAGGK